MYQVFKDFAGPIATIIAAFAAVSVTWRFAWRQTQIAKEQADIAKQKLHDVFERQYERRYRIMAYPVNSGSPKYSMSSGRPRWLSDTRWLRARSVSRFQKAFADEASCIGLLFPPAVSSGLAVASVARRGGKTANRYRTRQDSAATTYRRT